MQFVLEVCLQAQLLQHTPSAERRPLLHLCKQAHILKRYPLSHAFSAEGTVHQAVLRKAASQQQQPRAWNEPCTGYGAPIGKGSGNNPSSLNPHQDSIGKPLPTSILHSHTQTALCSKPKTCLLRTNLCSRILRGVRGTL